jgi:D-alanine-D-alanine ligase
MGIKKILVAFSKKIFEEREKSFFSNRPDLQGKTVHMVIEALTQIGWDCYQLNVDVPLVELVPSLSNQNANFVYNLAVCSAEAYDQAFLPTLLDALNIPYLGSNSTIHSLCLDRALTKLSLRGIGIPTTSSIQWSSGDSLPDSLDYPYIIKSRFRSYCQRVSSDSIVNDQESLLKKAEEIFNQTGEKVLIEKFVEGREMVIGLWGNGNNPEVLPIMELNLSRKNPSMMPKSKAKKGTLMIYPAQQN